MMPIARVQTPDGRVMRLEVPDGATEQQITDFASSQFASQQQPQQSALPVEPVASVGSPTLAPGPSAAQGQPPSTPAAPPEMSGTDLFLHRLGILGRGAVTGASGTVGMLGDALNSGINAAAGTHLQMPSQVIQNSMTQAGMPTPQTTDERVMGGLASVAGGMVDPAAIGIANGIKGSRALGGGDAPLYNAPPSMTTQQQTMKAAQGEGYKLPAQGPGGKLLESLSGSGENTAIKKFANQGVTGQVVRRELGLPKDSPLDENVLHKLIQDTYDTGYAPVAKVGNVTPGFQFYDDLSKVTRDNNGFNPSFPEASNPQVADLVSKFAVPNFDSAHALDQIKSLRTASSDAFRNGNTELGRAHKGIATALENAIENHLATSDDELLKQGIIEGTQRGGKLEMRTSGPDLLQNFRDARTAMAKQYAVRDALLPGSGEVNPTALAKNENLTGGLKTIGDFASSNKNLMGYMANEPPPLSRWESIGLGGAAIGHTMGLPTGIAASIPAARYGIRQFLASQPGQQMFSNVGPQGPNSLAALGPALPALLNGGLWNQQ